MLATIFPRQFDNRFRGQVAAVWLFGLVLLVKFAIGMRSILDGYGVARNADGVPMDSFAPAAAQQIVTLFGLLGLMHVTVALLGLVALLRYRAMIPLLFVLLLAERLGRQGALLLAPQPAGSTAGPGSYVTLALLAAMLLGLALSLWRRDVRRGIERKRREAGLAGAG